MFELIIISLRKISNYHLHMYRFKVNLILIVIVSVFLNSCNKDKTEIQPNPTTLAVGVSYQGGKIAYIFQSSDPGFVEGQVHGLIAAPNDNVTIEWGCNNKLINGADGTALGTGNKNTNDIIAGCGELGTAARAAADLVLGAYSDWYLPSKDELNKLYINRALIGGFCTNYYWSSTESNNVNAWSQHFYNGYQSFNGKYDKINMRAVRVF